MRSLMTFRLSLMRSWKREAAMVETFIMRKEWLDNLGALDPALQDKIIADIVRYGVGADPQHESDPIVGAFVNMVKGSIDASKRNYEQKVDMSQKAGRRKKIDDKKIYDLAQEGLTAQEIADRLEISKSSVDKSKGWQGRKEEFVF